MYVIIGVAAATVTWQRIVEIADVAATAAETNVTGWKCEAGARFVIEVV